MLDNTTAKRFSVVLGSLLLALTVAGCTITIDPLDPNANDPNAVDPNANPQPTTLTVYLINETNLELDPHLYVSQYVLSAEQLFVDSNIYANFDGATVIDPNTTVELTLNCSETKTIGSDQAAFGKWSDLQNAGRSINSPVIAFGDAENSPTYEQVILIRFYRDQAGDYRTSWTAVDPEDL